MASAGTPGDRAVDHGYNSIPTRNPFESTQQQTPAATLLGFSASYLAQAQQLLSHPTSLPHDHLASRARMPYTSSENTTTQSQNSDDSPKETRSKKRKRDTKDAAASSKRGTKRIEAQTRAQIKKVEEEIRSLERLKEHLELESTKLDRTEASLISLRDLQHRRQAAMPQIQQHTFASSSLQQDARGSLRSVMSGNVVHPLQRQPQFPPNDEMFRRTAVEYDVEHLLRRHRHHQAVSHPSHGDTTYQSFSSATASLPHLASSRAKIHSSNSADGLNLTDLLAASRHQRDGHNLEATDPKN